MVQVKDAKIRAQYERVYKSFVASAERHYYRGTPQGRAAARKIAGMVKNSNPKAYKFIITMVDFGTPDHFELIAKFIRNAMVQNTRSRDAEEIKALLNYRPGETITLVQRHTELAAAAAATAKALYLFYSLVKDQGKWDYKTHWHPSQKRRGKPGVKIWDPKRPKSGHLRYHYDPKTNTSFRHDIWSNISFGFAGRAVGFSREVLTGGSGVYSLSKEETLGDVWEKVDDFLRSDDLGRLDADASDIAAMRIGYDLYEKYGTGLSTNTLLAKIRASRGTLSTKTGRQ